MKKQLCAKIGTTVGALLVSTVAVHANVGINSGFYAGTSAGISSLSGKQNFNQVEQPNTLQDDRNMSLSAQSGSLGVFAGYGHKVNCSWLGAELSYLFDKLKDDRSVTINRSPANKTFQTRTTGSFGGAIHVGYVHAQTYLAYAILGFDYRRFEMNLLNPTQGVLGEPAEVRKKYSSLAFAPGVGMLVKLTKNISLRGEYKYAFHRSKTATASVVDTNGDTQVSTLKNTPRIQTFQLGIVYNF